MTTMTRAEAVCACKNIIELAEDLDEIAPAEFTRGLHDRATSMKERIVGNSQFSHITDGMDKALRNMWGGLCRWDRKRQFNDNLFYGLADVIAELLERDEDDGDVELTDEGDAKDSANEEGDTRKERGKVQPALESFDFQNEGAVANAMSATQAEKQKLLAAYNAQQKAAKAQNAAQQKERDTAQRKEGKRAERAPEPVVVQGLNAEDVAKERENCIAVALEQVHTKKISVVDARAAARHGALDQVLAKTSSDRTQQLIFVAYYIGKVSGMRMLGDALLQKASKEK